MHKNLLLFHHSNTPKMKSLSTNNSNYLMISTMNIMQKEVFLTLSHKRYKKLTNSSKIGIQGVYLTGKINTLPK